MATLVSPGVSVTVTDESFYASAGQGTVPLIFIATRENKLTPDGTTTAVGTLKDQANVLEFVTSQRELLNIFGNPVFEMNNGTVVQGGELNEYGLHAAYQYLGIANRAFVIRADIDLAQLSYNQDAPRGLPSNGTYWFDIVSSSFGVFRANGNATPGLAWDRVDVLLPSFSDIDVSNIPLSSYGVDGDICVVTQTTNNIVFEKISGDWFPIGSPAWQQERPTVALGTVTNPVFTSGNSIVINGETVTLTGTSLADIISDINGNVVLNGLNISASNNANRLQITNADGTDLNISGTEALVADISSVSGYKLSYSTHVSIPDGTKSGSIWVKTTDPNNGASYAVKRYSSQTGQFAQIAAPLYVNDSAADVAYGTAKEIGSLYVQYNVLGTLPEPIASHVIKRWDGTNWSVLSYEASVNAPSTNPDEGTLWISDELKVDIMVNDGDEWKGYVNHFPLTDPNGVQITSAMPTEQSDGTPLVENDLWLDSADVDNYPALYRYSSSTNDWVLIDKTDQTTPFGIVFADARNNEDGTENGSESPSDMVVSDYVDAGTPNPQTYPAGMLLFNTRYGTNNVKVWMPDFYSGQDAYTVGTASFPAPSYTARWVSASGNKADGSPYMGRFAQRIMVVRALAEVAANNEDVRSEFRFFNLMSAPGYPELIDELQTLNIDRKETAFIISDTPFRLAPNGTAIQNWANNTAETPSTDELGRTTRYTYSAMYYPQGLATNVDGIEVVVPSSTIALRTYAYNDSVAYPWFPPAGVRRGVVSNASSVGYITDEGEYKPVSLSVGSRDALYVNNINPIAFLPNRGLIVYGDKTLHPSDSALDRVNVARLIVYLRYQLDQIVQPFLFELNVDSTREAAKAIVERFLGDLLSRDALTDFAVQCDLSNNTPERIDRNELWIDVAIAPSKSINFIYIPIRLVRTGDL